MVILVSTQHVSTAPLAIAEVAGIAKNVATGIGGLSSFVQTIRSAYGKEGDFASKNGFDYDHVYNGVLQYQVINAYLNKNNAELLSLMKDDQHWMTKLLFFGGIVLILEISLIIGFIYTKSKK